MRLQLLATIGRIAAMPHGGQVRADLTTRPVRFWPAHGLLIVYRPSTSPVEILRVLHGARDPEALRREIQR